EQVTAGLNVGCEQGAARRIKKGPGITQRTVATVADGGRVISEKDTIRNIRKSSGSRLNDGRRTNRGQDTEVATVAIRSACQDSVGSAGRALKADQAG